MSYVIAAEKAPHQATTVRRSGNYHPTIWKHDFIKSLGSQYKGEQYVGRIEKLKESVRDMLQQLAERQLDQLEFIDALERLGVSYHFKDEIHRAMTRIRHDTISLKDHHDLHAAALKFRLLRHSGCKLLPDVFNSFKDKEGCFKVSLGDDVVGMLSLYEASFLMWEGESILEEARDFATRNLREYAKLGQVNGYLSLLVTHALELPLHWRSPRVEAEWFIGAYEQNQFMNPVLLELARLDFNMVQAFYHEDLKHLSRWWENAGLVEKLPFVRDRLVETFLWSVGVKFEPQFGSYRIMITKVGVIVTLLDDIYDIYGTVDELERLTDAIERWDVNAMDMLPDYMKITFLSLFNFVNQEAFDILAAKGLNVLHYLKQAWIDISKSYLKEVKWYNNGYKPTVEEYLDNGWISSTGHLLLVHTYNSFSNSATMDNSEMEAKLNDIMRWSSTILRLADDLGTSSHELKRGDNPKSIQCYMHESGVLEEEEARQYIYHLIGETWKKMNQDWVGNIFMFPEEFMDFAINLGRMAQYMYQNGDGHGVQADSQSKKRITSLLVQPMPIPS